MARLSISQAAWRIGGILLATNVLLVRGWLQAIPLRSGRCTRALSSSYQSGLSSILSTSSAHVSMGRRSQQLPLWSSAVDAETNDTENRPPRGARPPPVKPQGAFVLLEGMYMYVYMDVFRFV